MPNNAVKAVKKIVRRRWSRRREDTARPCIASCPGCVGFPAFDARVASALRDLGDCAVQADAPVDVAAAFVQLVADCANQAAWGLVEQALPLLEKVVRQSLEAFKTFEESEPRAQPPDISCLPEPLDLFAFPESAYLSREDVQARIRGLIAAYSEHDIIAVTTPRCRTAARLEPLEQPDPRKHRIGFMGSDSPYASGALLKRRYYWRRAGLKKTKKENRSAFSAFFDVIGRLR